MNSHVSDSAHWLAYDDENGDFPIAVITVEAERNDFSERGFRVEGPFVDPVVHRRAVNAITIAKGHLSEARSLPYQAAAALAVLADAFREER